MRILRLLAYCGWENLAIQVIEIAHEENARAVFKMNGQRKSIGFLLNTGWWGQLHNLSSRWLPRHFFIVSVIAGTKYHCFKRPKQNCLGYAEYFFKCYVKTRLTCGWSSSGAGDTSRMLDYLGVLGEASISCYPKELGCIY